MRRAIVIMVVAVLICGVMFGQAVEKKVKIVPAAYTDPADAAGMFKAYCASCHGMDAKGGGPAAAAMKTAMPDLTKLKSNNKGVFPRDHVSMTITGDALVPAHGSKEMPVWGPIFLSMDGRDRAVQQLRASNLTKYVESLQK